MRQRDWNLIVKLTNKEAFRQFLRFREISYGELAKRVGCSKSLIGHLATGERTKTSGTIAKAICQTLDVPVESLFCLTPLPSCERIEFAKERQDDYPYSRPARPP